MVEAREAVLVDREGNVHRCPSGGTLGRAPDCAVVVADGEASRQHAALAVNGRGWTIADLGSANGTFVNERRLAAGETVGLAPGDRIRVGQWIAELRLPDGHAEVPGPSLDLLHGPARRVVGRDPHCDVPLSDPQVSWHHAALALQAGRVEIHDLGSANGTFVNGVRVTRHLLSPGDRVLLARTPLAWEAGRLGVEPPLLEGRHLWRLVGGGCLPILRDGSVTFRRGQLIGVVGPSGSGKSTLVKVLLGYSPLDGGQRLFRGVDATRQTESLHAAVGYVPQDLAVHRELTVEQVMQYAARLRLPPDHGDRERARRIAAVLGELELLRCRDVAVERLSGGQQKRVGIAVELLAQPDVLFLDEPTSGLDPGLELHLRDLLRRLADGGQLVVAVTHALPMMEACDELVWMAPGGRVALQGPPREAQRLTGAGSLAEVFQHLETGGLSAARSPAPVDAPSAPAPPPLRYQPVRLARQALTLTERYLACFRADWRNLLLLLLQAPALALLAAWLFGGPVFDRGQSVRDDGSLPVADAVVVLFSLSTCAVWMGMVNSAREVVKERDILRRERLLGVGFGPYLFSKATVLLALAAVQVAVLVGVVAPAVALPGDAVGSLALVLGLAAAAATGLGLLVSTFARNTDQAMSLAVVLMVQQLLFSGALLPLERMSAGLRLLADLSVMRWAVGGAAAAAELVELNETLGRGDFVTDLMRTSLDTAVAALAALGLASLLAARAAVAWATTAGDRDG